MSTLSDVFAAIPDFRAELLTAQHLEGPLLSSRAARIGLRGKLGQLVSPIRNIHAVGIGVRRKRGRLFPQEFVIKVYVFHKKSGLRSQIPSILARPFHGVDIDIEELPVVELHAKRRSVAMNAAAAMPPGTRIRPVIGGMEIQPRGTSFVGTLGCFVKNAMESDDVVFALSNNHVLAGVNQLTFGTEIVQPRSGIADDVFARLTNYERIELPSPANPVPTRNRMDAAIARVSDRQFVQAGELNGIPNYLPILKAPTAGVEVIKSGRTTGVTVGRISATNVNGVQVNYGSPSNPVIGTFDGCVQIVGENGSAFSAGGDSGSIVLERQSGRPVALLFAGLGDTTTASDLNAICVRFSVVPI